MNPIYKKPYPEISIVLPVKNAAHNLEACANSILRQMSEQDELIIIDNDSTDSTGRVIESLRSKGVKDYFVSPASRGLARSFGVKKSRGQFVVMIDVDCQAGDQWLQEIVRPLRNGAAVVMGLTKSSQTNCWGNHAQIMDQKYLSIDEREKCAKNFTSSHFAFRRDRLDGIEFDPELVAAEDLDFQVQCRIKNVDFAFEKKAIAYHQYPSSLLVHLYKAFSRAYWSYQVFIKYHRQLPDVARELRRFKGLSKSKLLFNLAWTVKQFLKLFFCQKSQRYEILYNVLYENSWQFGVWCARLERAIKSYYFAAAIFFRYVRKE